MNYAEFMRHLDNKEPSQIYLLTGTEPYFINRAYEAVLNKIIGANDDREMISYHQAMPKIKQLSEELNTVPFFNDRNIIVIKEATIFLSNKKNDSNDELAAEAGDDTVSIVGTNNKQAEVEQLLAELENIEPTSFVIFIAHGKVDKRTKLYKTVDKIGMVLESNEIKVNNIGYWLDDKLRSINRTMDSRARAYLVQMLEIVDRSRVQLEFLDQQFDKIALYSNGTHITKEDIEDVFASFPEASVFSLINAIDKKDISLAMNLLMGQLRTGVYFTVIIAILSRHVRQLWQAKRLLAGGTRPKDLGAKMGEHPYKGELLGTTSKMFSEKQLKDAQLLLIDADYYLKTGQAGNELLEEIVIKLCK